MKFSKKSVKKGRIGVYQPTMVAEQKKAVAAMAVSPADVVSRICMIFQQARRVFKLGEISGGYFCLADGASGQELVCVRLGSVPHNSEALRLASRSREMVARVAGSSAAIPVAEPGAVKYGGLVAAFIGISPEIDSAITIAFAVFFHEMNLGSGCELARQAGSSSQFDSLFDRLETMGE